MSMFKHTIFSWGLGILILFQTTGFIYAGELNVGFTRAESINDLVCDNDWHVKAMGSVFWPLVYDQLWIMGPGPDYEALPRLADSWDTRDHKTWRFYLNEDAEFHDGEPVTSEDVIFTLLNLPKADSKWDTRDAAIKSYKIIDEKTFEITLDHIHGGSYPPIYWKPILPKHIWKNAESNLLKFDNKEAIGSGPYKVKEFVSRKMLHLVRNENFWGDRVGFDEIKFKSFKNSKAMNIALKDGQIDILGYQGLLPSMVQKFKEMDISMVMTPGLELSWLSYNLSKNSHLRDIRIRRAILHAINKKSIIKWIFRGLAKEADGFIFQEFSDYNKDIVKYKYNRRLAERILKKAGYVDKDEDGIRNDPRSNRDLAFTLMVPSAWGKQLRMAKMIQKQLQRIDLGVKLLEVSLKDYNHALSNLDESPFDITIVRKEVGPYSDWIWNTMKDIEKDGKGWNTANYKNRAFDKIVDRMMIETDLVRRRRYLFLMQEIMADDLPYAMLVRSYMISPIREDRIENYVTTMGGVSTRINPWTYLQARSK